MNIEKHLEIGMDRKSLKERYFVINFYSSLYSKPVERYSKKVETMLADNIWSISLWNDKKCGHPVPTKAVVTWGGKRKSWTRHPSSGQLRRETDLPSRGSLSRNCAYRVRHHRATNATPCKRGIGFSDAKIRVRGGDLVIRGGDERRIHVVRHLSDNLTTVHLSHPNPLSFLYVYCNTAERYIPETPRRFFSQLHALSFFLASFFPSFDKQTTQCKGCETGHVR